MTLGLLIRHELARLRLWIALLAAIDLSWLLLTLLLSPPETAPWVSSSRLFEGPLQPYAGYLTLAFALLLCQAGFPRDRDEGTLAFAFALPLSRARFFLARALAPALILSVEAVVFELLRWLLHLPAQGSFVGHTFRVDWLAATLATSLTLAWIAVGYGQLITVFGRFGPLIVLTTYLALNKLGGYAPWLRKLDPLSVLRVEFDGQHAMVAWGTLGGHALGGLLACCIAAWLWVGHTDGARALCARWTSRPPLRWLRRPWVRWSSGVLLAAGVGVWALASRDEAAPRLSRDASAPAAHGRGTLHQRTRFHEVTYSPLLAARVKPLVAVMDALHQRLAQRLGMQPGGHVVTVDFTRSSATHAGTTNWNTIRMDLTRSRSLEDLERVFLHETAHVFSLRASDRRTSSEHATVGFFSEGLAEALALELRPSAAVVGARRLEAALARRRLGVTFDRMIQFENFTQRYGPRLVYAMGFVWAQALVESCGVDAPQKVLKALGTPDAWSSMAPRELWRRLLRRAGCELWRVNDAWNSELAKIDRELQGELARVPTLRGGRARRKGDAVELLAYAEGEPNEGTRFFARVRIEETGEDARGKPIRGARREDGVLEFQVPASMAVDGALQFQLALVLERQGVPVSFSNEWTKTRVAH